MKSIGWDNWAYRGFLASATALFGGTALAMLLGDRIPEPAQMALGFAILGFAGAAMLGGAVATLKGSRSAPLLTLLGFAAAVAVLYVLMVLGGPDVSPMILPGMFVQTAYCLTVFVVCGRRRLKSRS